MLELRPICEHCGKALPFDSTEAMICAFECTFCKSCAETLLYNTCPNCDGQLLSRPTRNKKYIQQYPPVPERIYKPVDPQKILEIQRRKKADVHLLFGSSFYCITDFRCNCRECSTSGKEYSKNFGIAFIRKGHFVYNIFRNDLDAHTGRLMVEKPGYEYSVTHKGYEPDNCSIFSFTDDFYAFLKDEYKMKESFFFKDDDLHSILLNSTAELEYLHYSILEKAAGNQCSKLEIDSMVIELVDLILEKLTDISACKTLPASVKKNHLGTIEKAREYITANFSKDFSLQDLARHCHISPFHFSRLFKQFNEASPHQYLLATRLKHAETLIKTTNLPITDVCYMSGFNSIDHFSAAFTKKYKSAPSKYKTRSAKT